MTGGVGEDGSWAEKAEMKEIHITVQIGDAEYFSWRKLQMWHIP